MIGRILETPGGQPILPGPKYLGLLGDKPLFGWEEAILHPRGICVVEGPIDLLALTLWGMPGIALVGNQLRHDRLAQLDRFERLYVALDPDEGGRKGTQSLIAYFGSRAAPIELPDGDDVGRLAMYQDGEERFRTAVQAALATMPAPELVPASACHRPLSQLP